MLCQTTTITREFKTVFGDLVPVEGSIVFQKWDQDFEEWVDIGPLDSVDSKSKLKVFCQGLTVGSDN